MLIKYFKLVSRPAAGEIKKHHYMSIFASVCRRPTNRRYKCTILVVAQPWGCATTGIATEATPAASMIGPLSDSAHMSFNSSP